MTGKELLKKYNDPKNFFNRDLSWVEFNIRVLDEALNPNLPLLEKVKFVSIFSSNLDEFYMIRISGLKEQVAANILEPTIDGLTPTEQVIKIEKALKPMIIKLNNLWKKEIVPELKKHGVELLRFGEFNKEEQILLKEYFKDEIYPFELQNKCYNIRSQKVVTNLIDKPVLINRFICQINRGFI